MNFNRSPILRLVKRIARRLAPPQPDTYFAAVGRARQTYGWSGASAPFTPKRSSSDGSSGSMSLAVGYATNSTAAGLAMGGDLASAMTGDILRDGKIG